MMDLDIAEDVKRFGWSLLSVNDSNPPFVYTAGLMFTRKHPEMILFGLRTEGANILCSMFELIGQGQSFATPGAYGDVLRDGAQIAVRRVHPTQHQLYLGFAMGYCTNHGRLGELEAIQVFWPDKQGKFPFERGCEESVWHAQPRLDQPVNPDELREFHTKIGDLD